MNVANLQLEGLLMAVASINHELVRKGVLSADEVDMALRKAEANETDQDRSDQMSSSNRDAINFPIRLLQLANRCKSRNGLPSFSTLTKLVGQGKEHYNDEM